MTFSDVEALGDEEEQIADDAGALVSVDNFIPEVGDGRKRGLDGLEVKPTDEAPENQTMPISVYRLSRTVVTTEALLRDDSVKDVSGVGVLSEETIEGVSVKVNPMLKDLSDHSVLIVIFSH